VDVPVFGPLDVPVMLMELVVEDVRVRQVRVQRIDDLFSLVLVESDRIRFDGTSLLSEYVFGSHAPW